MTSSEFVQRLIKIVQNYKTIYVLGCFGSPMTEERKKYFIENHEYNKRPERMAIIKAATPDIFGFDCSGLIKGILWGWFGDKKLVHGGAVYKSNNVSDYNADHLISVCRDVSDDFSQIVVGEALWVERHIGVYIGNGFVVESTPLWNDGVQITTCNCSKDGYYGRVWAKHGKLPYIIYD